MLIDTFVSKADVSETHCILIRATPDVVYHALKVADLGDSLIIKSLLGLRTLPELVAHPRRSLTRAQTITLALS